MKHLKLANEPLTEEEEKIVQERIKLSIKIANELPYLFHQKVFENDAEFISVVLPAISIYLLGKAREMGISYDKIIDMQAGANKIIKNMIADKEDD